MVGGIPAQLERRAFFPPLPVATVALGFTTDVSGAGLGAAFGLIWLYVAWPPAFRAYHVTVLELFAVVVAVHCWGEECHDTQILLHTDNMRLCASAAPAPFCPFTALHQLLGTHPTFASLLVAFRDGSYLTRARLGHILHAAFHSSCDLNTHSFRIGGTSAAGAMGFSSAMLQAPGQLQSDSFRHYAQLPSKCVPSPAPCWTR